MSEGGAKKGRLALWRFWPVIQLASAWLGLWFTGGNFFASTPDTWSWMVAFWRGFAFRAFGGFPAAQAYAVDLVTAIDASTAATFGAFVAWATFLVPLGFALRILARAKTRTGGVDPIERLRAWDRAHPNWSPALFAVLPLLWGWHVFKVFDLDPRISLTHLEALPVVLASVALEYKAARVTFRAFLQPTVDPTEESRIEIGPDEITFDAVAVTRETRAAVGGLAGLSVAMIGFIAALPIGTLYRDRRLFAAMVAYMVVAAVTATVFRVASRVAVGIDGVLVKGTSRTRFFAYRDIDDARVTNGDVELVRKGRVVLRLQLHGVDAIRRDAVLARIRENIARVQRGEHAVAAQLVSSASKGELARVASGGADYRAASLSREALWQLIEGPTVDADARRAAATALAKTSDESERVRLRVAAEHCADPQVRVALAELAEALPAVEVVPAPRPRLSRT
jgi:hypothetical protein